MEARSCLLSRSVSGRFLVPRSVSRECNLEQRLQLFKYPMVQTVIKDSCDSAGTVLRREISHPKR